MDTTLAVYDDQDRLLSYGNYNYTYDKNGNLTSKYSVLDTTYYSYDNFGNLRTVIKPDSSIIEYKINASNQRIAKVKDGVIEKKWLYSGGLLPVAELDSADNISVLYGPGYIVKGDTTYRVITNHLGSVKLIVNAATGEIVLSNSYNEWGNLTAQTGNAEWQDYNFAFAGGLYDHDTKLVRFGARDYNPEIGRWTAKDPIGFGGGQSNFYEYCLNDPVNTVDLEGLQSSIFGPIPILGIKISPRALFIAGMSALGGVTGAIIGGAGGAGAGLVTGPVAVVASPSLAATGAAEGAVIGSATGLLYGNWLANKVDWNDEACSGNKEPPASEKTAKDFAKQIERDLGKNARREFHDVKTGNDRTLQELRQDAADIYQRYGKSMPRWMQPK